MERILIYHNGALGDFVTLLPGLRLARAVRPAAVLALLGRTAHGELARSLGLVDEVLDAGEAKYRGLYGSTPDVEVRQLLGNVDQALLVTSSTELGRRVRDFVRRVDVQPPLPARPLWMYEYNTRFVARALDVDPGGAATRACLEGPPAPAARLPSSPVVWLHPGSGSRLKSWPPVRYGELGRELRRAGHHLRWSFGPADSELAADGDLGREPDDELSLDEPPAVLARDMGAAAYYVGSDTGVTHLAAAMGSSVIAIFGPTDERVWRPLGRAVRVLKRRDVCASGRSSVCRIGSPADCRRRAAGIPACLWDIRAADVLAAMEQLADTGRRR